MTLVQLANFVRIAELRSLSKAAAVIRIAQPALSRQIRLLELEFGAPLLVRHARGVLLTEAGDVLLTRARRLLADAEDVREAVSSLSSTPAGPIALGVPSSLSTALLPLLAASLRRKHPMMRPRFVDGFSASLHARTVAGELDLAILYDDRALGPLSTTPLLTEELLVIGPAPSGSRPASPDAIWDQTLILPAYPNRLRMIVDGMFAEAGRNPKDVYEVDSLPALIEMIRAGMGLSILPHSTVAREIAEGVLSAWPLSEHRPSRRLLIGRPLDRPANAAVVAVEHDIRVIVGQLRDDMRWRPLVQV